MARPRGILLKVCCLSTLVLHGVLRSSHGTAYAALQLTVPEAVEVGQPFEGEWSMNIADVLQEEQRELPNSNIQWQDVSIPLNVDQSTFTIVRPATSQESGKFTFTPLQTGSISVQGFFEISKDPEFAFGDSHSVRVVEKGALPSIPTSPPPSSTTSQPATSTQPPQATTNSPTVNPGTSSTSQASSIDTSSHGTQVAATSNGATSARSMATPSSSDSRLVAGSQGSVTQSLQTITTTDADGQVHTSTTTSLVPTHSDGGPGELGPSTPTSTSTQSGAGQESVDASNRRRRVIIAGSVTGAVVALLLGFLLLYCMRPRKGNKRRMLLRNGNKEEADKAVSPYPIVITSGLDKFSPSKMVAAAGGTDHETGYCDEKQDGEEGSQGPEDPVVSGVWRDEGDNDLSEEQARDRRIVRHEDSGWRPTVAAPRSEAGGSSVVHMPPTYAAAY
ncbi:hypothetical protein V5O48_004572 [Marasmius crinis-equi]|uniref:Uncharacterized protein n=1 Tax=Marasmius crinis-equi TaxID=585013 RepID=A0ABR3FPP8_9AGAR